MTTVRLSRPLLYVVLAGITVVMLYPFYYMITTSLHSSDQYQLGSGGYSLSSWRNLFNVLPVWRQLLNSTIVSHAGYLMTEGGPVDSTLFYAYNLFNHAFRFMHMGYASAMAWVLFIITLIATLILFKTSARLVYYEGDQK